MLTKQETIGKGCQGREQEGKGTQENCSALCLAVSGFMVMGLVSELSLANHSDSESILGAGITRPRGTPARRILGGGRMYGLVTFSNSSGWGALVGSKFLLLSDHSCGWLPWCLAKVVVLDSGAPNTGPGPAHSAFPTAPHQSSVKRLLRRAG